MEKKIYIIDGARFTNLTEFYEEISTVLIRGELRITNLDSFNDVLHGGFGTPDEGFILVWRNADKSKLLLGYEATANYYEKIDHKTTQGLSFEEWFERNKDDLRGIYARTKADKAIFHETVLWVYNFSKDKVTQAQNQQGKTLFDIIVEIIREHPKIELRLE